MYNLRGASYAGFSIARRITPIPEISRKCDLTYLSAEPWAHRLTKPTGIDLDKAHIELIVRVFLGCRSHNASVPDRWTWRAVKSCLAAIECSIRADRLTSHLPFGWCCRVYPKSSMTSQFLQGNAGKD